MLSPTTLLSSALAVFCGAFLGGACRFWLSRIPAPRVGTFTANVAACAVLGFVALAPARWQLACGVGFAGALSTFSTLAREIGELCKARSYRRAANYVLLTAAFGVAAAGFGALWGRSAFFA